MDNKIRAVIIEDDKKQILFLQNLLIRFGKEVEVIGTASNVNDGIKLIDETKPELVFLDVELGNKTCFDILQSIKNLSFKIIFTTGFEKYAARAFEFAALDYLIKPINPLRLQEAISRFKEMQSLSDDTLNILLESINEEVRRIKVETTNGFAIIKVNEIVRFEIKEDLVLLILSNGEVKRLVRPLNYFEELLSDLHFVRIHDKHFINLNFVTEYKSKFKDENIEHKSRGGFVFFKDGTFLEISVRKKDVFLEKTRKWIKT
ncbi:MAG: response regulator transcription factor [Ignavibacteriales bacterium]|nr:response regulator transcription factor [Ignavibacteriales bacterium]